MAKPLSKKEVKQTAQKVTNLKQVQICAQSALDNEQDVKRHKASMGTENSLYIAILNAFPNLKTPEDVLNAKNKVYDLHYETSEGTRQWGRKGATVKEFPKQRIEAPRGVANVFTLLNKAVSPIVYSKDGKDEVKFGYADFLDSKGLHAYPLLNSEKDGEDGLKKIVNDKEKCPSRNKRNALIALRQQKLDDEKAKNKEALKMTDDDYEVYVKSL
jgi:hypothetical protein|tara:strand:+ start:680 stop:1324 length:645 start_codon:yes stop_codon:yes gene_type:complete